MKYRAVSDDLRASREPAPVKPDPPVFKPLLQGRTVFISEVSLEEVQALRQRMAHRHGHALRRRSATIKGVDGFILWLEES